jgi:hypothetical protein
MDLAAYRVTFQEDSGVWRRSIAFLEKRAGPYQLADGMPSFLDTYSRMPA